MISGSDMRDRQVETMTPQQTVGLGVRLFAIWLAICSIRYFSSVPAAIIASHPALNDRLYESYIVGGAYLFIAFILWFFPMTVAHKLIPRTSFTDKLTVEIAGAARVGCCLIGLWFFATSLQSIIWILFLSVVTAGDNSLFNSISPANKVDLATSLLESALAIALMTRSSVFARIVTR